MNHTTKAAMINDIYSGNGEKSAVEKFYESANYLNNNTETMATIQAQNLLTAVHHQFHQNQGKYIELLTKMVECQATLLEKYQNSPALPEVMQNLEQILQILQINQSHYNTSHEGYLQNQLALMRGEQFPTNTSNTVNGSPPSRLPNYRNPETETAIPSSDKKDGQKAIDALASSTPTSATVSTSLEIAPATQPIATTSEIISHPVETAKPEEQKSIDASASSTPTSATVSTSPKIIPALQPIAITSETISNSGKTAKPEGQDALASQSVISTPTSPLVTTISENINDSIESISSTNVPSAAPLASEVNSEVTNSVDITKLSNRLLEVVSDKTGYPIDMLDMDMDLEADLGIDSIKQIQIFGAMQNEFPDIVLDTEVIGELRTMAKIIDYLKEYLSGNQTTQPSSNLDQQVAIERQIVKKNT